MALVLLPLLLVKVVALLMVNLLSLLLLWKVVL